MKRKTWSLDGAALDWAVAKCLGVSEETLDPLTWIHTAYPSQCYLYSSVWAQGGPIIERKGISMRFSAKDARGAWFAVLGPNRFFSPDFEGSGPTPLIAAMRCLVASKLGDEIEIPEELV